jgi:hypothetical protein
MARPEQGSATACSMQTPATRAKAAALDLCVLPRRVVAGDVDRESALSRELPAAHPIR